LTVDWQQIEQRLAAELPKAVGDARRVLLIVPDATRTAPVARLVPWMLSVLRAAGRQVNIIVALGTHQPMPRPVLLAHLGLTEATATGFEIWNHQWDDLAQLASVGEIPATRIAELTGGLLAEPVALTINRHALDHDRLLILGPVFPHEVAGFSGGSKYLFPGISGPEMVDATHWLAAVITNLKIIGVRDNPVRAMLNEGAARVPVPVSAVSLVMDHGELAHVAVGPLLDSWRSAVAESARRHVTHTGRQYRRVLSCAPAMYEDLWTGGKCMYKLEAVVADGGELVIYAPHVTSFSETHHRVIERIGYHVRDYFLSQMEKFAGVPRAVMGYCTLVKGAGTFVNGVERPRIRVSFASGLSRAACERVNIGYVDPVTIDAAAWRNDPDTLVVAKAGEMLYQP
jgi:lactate racemase